MIKYPEMRADLLDVLKALADPEHQRRVWVQRRYPRPGYYDDLDMNINFLYDDSDLAEDPHRYIGAVLRNEEEAKALERLGQVLGPLYDSLPPNTADSAVKAMPQWKSVLAAAQKAMRGSPPPARRPSLKGSVPVGGGASGLGPGDRRTAAASRNEGPHDRARPRRSSAALVRTRRGGPPGGGHAGCITVGVTDRAVHLARLSTALQQITITP